MPRKKNYILYDMQKKRKYPPMCQSRIAETLGCSRANVSCAVASNYLIGNRWHVTELQAEDENVPDTFPEEWDKARYRILNLRR